MAALLFAIFPAHIWGQAASPAPADKPVTVRDVVCRGLVREGWKLGERAQAAGTSGAPSSSFSMPASSSRRRSLKRHAGLPEGGRARPRQSPTTQLAADVARSHAVTALIQAAAKDRLPQRCGGRARGPDTCSRTRPEKYPGHRASARTGRRRSAQRSQLPSTSRQSTAAGGAVPL